MPPGVRMAELAARQQLVVRNGTALQPVASDREHCASLDRPAVGDDGDEPRVGVEGEMKGRLARVVVLTVEGDAHHSATHPCWRRAARERAVPCVVNGRRLRPKMAAGDAGYVEGREAVPVQSHERVPDAGAGRGCQLRDDRTIVHDEAHI